MNLFSRLCVSTVDILNHAQHARMYAVRLADVICRQTAQFDELHITHGVRVRDPGSTHLEDANSMPASHALMLFPPPVDELIELRIGQSLVELDDSAWGGGVEE